jgi:hypothetical protein
LVSRVKAELENWLVQSAIYATPYSEGLAALASGFSIISKDDHDNMAKQFYVYDALYAFCKSDNKEKLLSSRH